MNPLDIFIIIVFGFCLIRGLFRGLIKELSSIIGVMGGFYAAYTFYPQFAKILSRFITDPSYLHIISFIVLFCGILIIISLIGVLIKHILKIAFLLWVDRLMGGIFGAIKGILIVSVFLLTITSFLPKEVPVIKNSQLSPFITIISEKMAGFVPKDMKRKYSDNIKLLKKAWKTQKK